MVKAYALTTIHRRVDGEKDIVPASTKERISVFDTDADQLEKLISRGAARKATKEEIAVAKVQSGETDAPTNVEKLEAAQTTDDNKAPDSGAEGDPQGKPKGTSKTAAKDSSKDEEI